jgi:hypothetical protein
MKLSIKKSFTKVAALAATGIIATSAMAAVLLNPDGTGFVGKGDVQQVFGWNNAQAQRNFESVDFEYDSTDTYDVVCEWTTVTGGQTPKVILHDVTVPKHTKVKSKMAFSVKTNKQGANEMTGWHLGGWGEVQVDGTTPVLGGTCPNGGGGLITEVTQTDSKGGLYVKSVDGKKLLPSQ